MDPKVLARARLDQRLAPLRALDGNARPRRGWVRALRDALGMSSRELAERMGVTQQAAIRIEQSEARGSIRLDTLQRAANALDCELVYYLVPRRTLESMVTDQATRKAEQHLARVAHHSRLEDQSVTESDTASQVADLARALIDRRGLWSDGDSSRS